MTFYKSSDQFYALINALFDRVQQNKSGASDAVNKAKLLVRLNCHEPAAIITINGRRYPVEVAFGKNGIRPEVDVYIATDTLHQILMGKLTLPKAIAAKLLKVRGPAHKTLAVAELFYECQAIYPGLLSEMGYQL